jgi:hypothetical protein
MRGNAISNVTIASNILQTANTKWDTGATTVTNSSTDGIAITIGAEEGDLKAASGTSSFTITDNTIGITKPTAGDKAEGIKIELFGSAAQSAPINLTFNIIGNTITSPNGDLIEFATPSSGGYTNSANTLKANIWNNTLNKTVSGITGSANDGFKFESNTGNSLTSTLSIKNNIFNVNGKDNSAFAIQVTQKAGGSLYTLFTGNSSLVNTFASNKTILLEQFNPGTVFNVGSTSQTEANNNGMTFTPIGTVNTITELP